MKRETDRKAKADALNMLKKTDKWLLVTEDQAMVYGPTPDLLTMYSEVTRAMTNLKGSNKDIVKTAFDMAFASKEELHEMLDNVVEELLNNLKELKEQIKKD